MLAGTRGITLSSCTIYIQLVTFFLLTEKIIVQWSLCLILFLNVASLMFIVLPFFKTTTLYEIFAGGLLTVELYRIY